jgi:hypothetical protein
VTFEVWIDEDALNRIGGLYGNKAPGNELTADEMKEEISDALDNQGLEGFYSIDLKMPKD